MNLIIAAGALGATDAFTLNIDWKSLRRTVRLGPLLVQYRAPHELEPLALVWLEVRREEGRHAHRREGLRLDGRAVGAALLPARARDDR